MTELRKGARKAIAKAYETQILAEVDIETIKKLKSVFPEWVELRIAYVPKDFTAEDEWTVNPARQGTVLFGEVTT